MFLTFFSFFILFVIMNYRLYIIIMKHAQRYFLLIQLLCVIALLSCNTSKNYLNLIENNKYSKAEKLAVKSFNKNPLDPGVNYVMARLYMSKDYKGYNSSKAYEYIINTETYYATITDKQEIEKLNNIPLNTSIIQSVLNVICKSALDEAIAINSVEAYDEYLSFFSKAQDDYKSIAIENRDLVAFESASQRNTVETYEDFISTYPKANQIKEAISRRNKLAFEIARSKDTINEYNQFINKYPSAIEVNHAKQRIHELAFEEASKINTAAAYKNFISKYPNSKQYSAAFRLFEKNEFLENTTIGNWKSYQSFIESYLNSSWSNAAKDSIYAISSVTQDREAIKYSIDNFSGKYRENALLLLHKLFTDDGETVTLDLFYSQYDDPIFEDIKLKDYELAEQGDRLSLESPYDKSNYYEYDNYIRAAAPKERAFLALQRMIEEDVKQKRWQSALTIINNYTSYFGTNNKKIKNLIAILEADEDKTLKIQLFGPDINTTNGGEYVPVITADDKYIYFCGRDRNDNVGGEDIFVASFKPRSPAKVVYELSTPESNEAPLSISTDGTSLIYFINGQLFIAKKTKKGWEYVSDLGEQINTGSWQADAMISSDGNALIFSSIRESNFDIHVTDHKYPYHGSNNYASDIYVSLKDENDNWGPPTNLGPTINTMYCDRSPFLHPDMKTLYFSSSGHGGLGDLDVFKSTRLRDDCWDCWSEPINLGKDINTTSMDWGYKITTDGDKAYFAKENKSNDIHWFNLPPSLRPNYVATVSGQLLDTDNKPLEAEIKWEDLQSGKSIGSAKSDPVDGRYFIVLPLGKIYGYYVDKEGYFPISSNLDLRSENKSKQVEFDITMVSYNQMKTDGSAVPINNLFFGFGEYTLLPFSMPELKRVADIIKSNNLKVEIAGHTDNIGDDSSNQLLSEKRANAVKEYLIMEGCDESMLTTIGFGESKPVAPNNSDSNREKNRRVELRFIQ